jgi:PAS domain S-box-containing protein
MSVRGRFVLSSGIRRWRSVLGKGSVQIARTMKLTGSWALGAVRDETARKRDRAPPIDELAARRARKAAVAEERVLELERSDEIVGGRTLRVRVRAMRERAVTKRRCRLPEAGREFKDSDVEQSRVERERALDRGRSPSVAERITSELAQQRSRLIEAQSIAQLGSWEWDVATDTIDWSDELCRIYGLRPGQHPVSFEEYLERLHPDDRPHVQAALQAAYASGEPFAFKHRIVRPDGSVRVLNGLGEVIIGDDGQVRRMLGTGQDITERELLESELRRGSRYFELSRDLTVTLSFDGLFRSVNPVVTDILGWSAEEFLARAFIDMVHPDDRAAMRAEVNKLADEQTTLSFVNRLQARDGSYRWLDWNAIVPPDEKLIYAWARDVTQRKYAKVALAGEERQRRQTGDGP